MIQDPVAPIEMGRAPAERAGADGGPPVVMVSEETQVAGTAVAGGESGRTAANVNYVIASGDTLSKIAKKFYHDATPSNIQRIVAANPGVLKNEHTVILAGRKLMIPVAARTLVRAPEPMTGGVVPLPGDSGAQRGTLGSRARDGVPAKTAPTYVVQAGDTLSKIARKLAPGHAAQMVKTLVALNGIKDRDSLEVGMKLKVPA